ncbi:MAG: hypothetical protein M1401_15225 [Chloroflexi bacterium]|nr:hypothetical protein [Chloroflexota bacterium]MCL5110179.1 hypothetical protein [Chloroflexota bacterium]
MPTRGTRWVGATLASILIIATLLPMVANGQTAPVEETSVADLLLPPNFRFGLSRASFGADVQPGYQQGLSAQAGASWNRWPLYWYLVENGKGLDYSAYDRAVAEDAIRGTNLDLVLMGTPKDFAPTGKPKPTPAPPSPTPASPTLTASAAIPTPVAGQTPAAGPSEPAQAAEPPPYSQAATPPNLDQPVFADGSDNLAPGKQINPDNYWARFVNSTVQRYRPGGGLSAEGLLPKGVGVRYWEIWNEPDVTFYWSARGPNTEVRDYFRLLKVAYLAAKAADPEAVLIIGGLSYWGRESWLEDLLNAIAADPASGARNQYFDVIAWHVYSRPLDLYIRASWTRKLLADRHLANKQVWINETNIPVWGDSTPAMVDPGSHRGSPEEQASFTLQAYAYAFAGGADKVFTFMLYDDCWQWGEHYGLVRNPPGPYKIDDCAADGRPRPGYAAYKVAAAYLRDIKSSRLFTAGPDGKANVATFEVDGGLRVIVAWNKSSSAFSVDLPLTRPALLVDQSGATLLVRPNNKGAYTLNLPPATDNDAPSGEPPNFIVGGRTYVLVELADAPASGQLINGGFEMQPRFAAWITEGSPPMLAPLSRTGRYAASLKVSPPVGGISQMRQSIIVPADGKPLLTFSYAIFTAQSRGLAEQRQSTFKVTARAPGEPEKALLMETLGTDWVTRRLDLRSYAGKVLTITFTVAGQEEAFTAFVDNVSLSTYQIYLPLVPKK